MKQILPLFLCGIASLMLSACSTMQVSKDTTAVAEGGMMHIENEPAQFSFNYFGDYASTSFKVLDTVNALHPFFKSIASSHPGLLFAGKTRISPFCSSVIVRYKQTDLASMLAETNKNIEMVYHSKPVVTDTLIGSQMIHCIEYMLTDPGNEQQYQFLEYQYQRKDDILRLIFWSTEPDLHWLHEETISLIKEI